MGGTNYYIESLLWKVLVNPPLKQASSTDNDENTSHVQIKKIKLSNENESAEITQLLEGKHATKTSSPVPAQPPSSSLSSASGDETNLENINLISKNNLKDLYKYTSSSLHKHLETIDPISASRLHPNNKRKIIR